MLDGSSLNGAAVARRACDAAVHRAVVEGLSTSLDYGTSTRTIPTPLWNALVVRDEHCCSGRAAELHPDGTFTVTDPYGRVRTTAPPRALLVC